MNEFEKKEDISKIHIVEEKNKSTIKEKPLLKKEEVRQAKKEMYVVEAIRLGVLVVQNKYGGGLSFPMKKEYEDLKKGNIIYL